MGGKITRVNTKNSTEYSAIDFVLASEGAEPWVQKMNIDEEGIIKVKGRNQSDHNTITLELKITSTNYPKPEKRTSWNIRAPEAKWEIFAKEINRRFKKAKAIISNPTIDINTKYNKWFQELENAARKSIGKTTIKEGRKEKPSEIIKQFNQEKKQLRVKIQGEKDLSQKESLIKVYKELQEIN